MKNDSINDKSPEKLKPRWWLIILLIFFWWAAILIWLCVGLSKSAKSSTSRATAKIITANTAQTKQTAGIEYLRLL